MLTDCPLGRKETHACWHCPFTSVPKFKFNGDIEVHCCRHKRSVYKVKPRKITHGFCQYCKEYVRFYLDWMGCVWPTDKGIVSYRELEAHCPHCYREIYVPAVNDVNVYRRNKAYAEKVSEEPIKIGTTEDLIKMCEECKK